MKRTIIVFSVGVLCGLGAISIPVLSSERVAAIVSQSIYDCGIRVAGGASDGAITGFNIQGHKTGICVDTASNLSITGNSVQ